MIHVNRVVTHREGRTMEFSVVFHGLSPDRPYEELLGQTYIGSRIQFDREHVAYWHRIADIAFELQHPPVTTSKLTEVISWIKEAGLE